MVDIPYIYTSWGYEPTNMTKGHHLVLHSRYGKIARGHQAESSFCRPNTPPKQEK